MAWKRVATWAVAISAAALLMTPAQCRAQDPAQDHSCTIGAAVVAASWPKGDDGRNFHTSHEGFQVGGGFQVWTNRQKRGSRLFVTANYMFQKFTATRAALSDAKMADAKDLANATSAHGTFSAGTLDLTYRYVLNRHWSFYGSGGFGWFRRSVGFSGASPGTLQQPSGASLLRRGSDSGVFDLGGGVNFDVHWGLMAFAEVRVYHGAAINSSTTLLPLSVGFRW
jgi:outer membrane scaffolding protein for murein synthesis (MipA/OmpV family)